MWKIKQVVEESEFKSEEYIGAFFSYPGHINHADMAKCGRFISGEIKLAINIRLLAGGDSLDIGVIFDIYPSSLMRICY